MLSCSVDNDPSLSYFSLAIPSNSGYEVEEVVVWINPDFPDFTVERIEEELKS